MAVIIRSLFLELVGFGPNKFYNDFVDPNIRVSIHDMAKIDVSATFQEKTEVKENTSPILEWSAIFEYMKSNHFDEFLTKMDYFDSTSAKTR